MYVCRLIYELSSRHCMLLLINRDSYGSSICLRIFVSSTRLTLLNMDLSKQSDLLLIILSEQTFAVLVVLQKWFESCWILSHASVRCNDFNLHVHLPCNLCPSQFCHLVYQCSVSSSVLVLAKISHIRFAPPVACNECLLGLV